MDRVRVELNAALAKAFSGANKIATANKPKEVVSIIKNTLYKLETAQEVKNIALYEDQIIAEYDDTDATQINAYVPAPIVPGLHKICGMIVLTI
jgi:hypothetical protein